MKFFLFILTVFMISSSKGIRLFDPGDCNMDPRYGPVVVACFGKYDSLTGLTDEKYNQMNMKDQTQLRRDFFAAGTCVLRFARILDEDEFMHEDKLLEYYERYLFLEPACRKTVVLQKIQSCFKNYKDKKQNFPVAFCFYIAQMEGCAEDYRSLDGKCKAGGH